MLHYTVCALYEEMRPFSLSCIRIQFSFELAVVICSAHLLVLTKRLNKWFNLTLRIPHNAGLDLCPETSVFVACVAWIMSFPPKPNAGWYLEWPRRYPSTV
jgi:uncharacterized protein YcnI